MRFRSRLQGSGGREVLTDVNPKPLAHREQKMNHDDEDLLKQHIDGEAAYGHTEPPPFAKPPDMAETLRLLERVSRMPDIRFDKVQHMRELITQGKLETPERVDGTVRRLMEELGL